MPRKMQSAVIAAFFHCCSSNQNPMHGQCPTGKDSWCKYKQALSDGKVYVDKTAGLSNYVIKVIKPTYLAQGCGSPVVKVSNHGRHVMSSIQVPLKTRPQRCTLNLSRAETSSRWCGVVVREGVPAQVYNPRHLTMVQNYVVRRQKPSCS
ncbi:uncharacterized protein TNCV_320831 [Trichonephila clavipes]|nr:uncharacterized protein TNCV_320831 [Trichonephila clavipes]